MKDWIKKNRDTILITAGGIATTAVVVLVTHKIVTDHVSAITRLGNYQMSMIAEEAGVLDKIIEHQEKLLKVANK